MFQRMINYAFYGDTDKDNYTMVKDKIEASNRMTAHIFASVAAILIGIMYLISLKQETLASSGPVYICGVLCSLLILIVSVLGKNKPIMSYVSLYMSVSVFLLYGIAIATLTRPEDTTVTFMVLLIFVPLIFTDRPIRMAVVLIFYIVVFIVMAYRTEPESVFSVDVTDAVVFGLLSIVSESIVNRSKIKGYVLENQLHIMSETDQLTGLNNRNCYEWRLSTYPELYHRSICCIYIDVNGLHEFNNTKGHKAGDEMLRNIANIVKKIFGESDTFRIGGDEYVALVLDGSLSVIQEKIAEMNAQIGEKGYHVAVGYEYVDHKGVNMNKLIVEAESRMYKDKSEYYKKMDRQVNGRESGQARR